MKNKIVAGLLFLLVITFGWWLTDQPTPIEDPYKALKTDRQSKRKYGFPTKLQTQVPVLKVKGDTSLNLQYNSLQIKSYLDNGYARTRYELIITNPHDQTLEAEFELFLNEGQTLTAFALEVNGEMRPAVAVEKKKARIAYEATVRKGIDPGLIEHIAGNAFRMRVFPLLSRVPKKLVFEVSAVLAQDAKQAYFSLPLQSKNIFGHFSYKAISYRSGKPVVLRNYHFYKKPLDLSIQIKRPFAQQEPVSLNQIDGYRYFSKNLPLPLKYVHKKAPHTLTVCWDASASRANLSDRKKELEFLLAYLRRIPNGRLELICFAHQVLEKKYFDIQKGKVPGLRSFLEELVYDGGSTLACLRFGKMKGEEVLLFTDGLQTLGPFHFYAGKTAIYPIVNGDKNDKGLILDIAHRTNGKVIDLRQLTQQQALQQLSRRYLRFLGFKEECSGLAYYTTELDPTTQRLMLSVRAPHACKKLTAQFGLDAKNVLAQTVIDLSKNTRVSVGRSEVKRWALAKLAHLETRPQENQQAILALGIKHRLVSSATSLLVLDALEDYLEHQIVPPPSMQKAYFKALAEQKKQQNPDPQKSHLKQLRKDWKAYQRWYWKDPKKRKKQKIEPERHSEQNFSIAPPSPQEMEEPTSNFSVNPSGANFNLNATATGANATFSWSNSAAPSGIDLSSGYGTYHVTVSNTNGSSVSAAPQATIALAAWNPKASYLRKLRRVPFKDAYRLYLQLIPTYAAQPSFFIDVADFFSAKHDAKTAIRILTNLAEMELKDVALMRVVAQKLIEYKAEKLALVLLKEVLELRPEEPQSYRDYALALAEDGQYDLAVSCLWKLVQQPFDGRFSGIHLIALNEINHLLVKHPKEIDARQIPSEFRVKLPVDIRVVLNWDADDTDVDLWVTEPNGEKCMYSYKHTTNGGRISNDFTQGYGPEEYVIRKAPRGTYTIQAHYYGNHRPTLSGKAILTVQFFQYYGTPFEVRRVVTRRLGKVDEEIDLATFEF